MQLHIDFSRRARRLPYDVRKNYLLSLPETEMHEELKTLFERMDDNDLVEVTHGKDEFGRDLVVKHSDPWGYETYRGVVVKKGDPKGKLTGATAGVIDEVLMQVDKALSHPCPLREIGAGSVSISEIRVVFVGRLTSTASWRVENEVQTALVRVFSVGWLIEKFTDYYPQVFFEGKLAEFIQEKVSFLETHREFPVKPSKLSASFVNPWVLEIESPLDLTEAVMEVFRTRRLPFTKLEEIVDERKRILLIGDPGTGKSTALSKIALDMFESCLSFVCASRSREQVGIPVLIKATDIVSKDIDELVDANIPPEPVRSRVKVKVLLVDGLDEVNIDNRSTVVTKLQEFCDNYGCGLVISTRKVETLKEAIVPFRQYELLPFEYRQAVDFIRRLVDDTNLIRILEEGLRRDDLKMSLTPMSLELLIEIATIEKEIPASTTEVYERYTDIVLGRYDIARGVESVFEYFIKKKFLAELAWHEFYLRNRLVVSRGNFDSFVNQYTQRYKGIKVKFRQFLAEINRAGVLQIGDTVFFRHRSFLEYFSALRLVGHQAEHKNLHDDVANLYFDYMWTDVAFYYIGTLREISNEIVKRLDRYDETQFESMILKALLGRLLQAGWYTPSEIKLQAMSIALRQTEHIRARLDSSIESERVPIPTIFTDFFIMALTEYSFGSRTFLDEVLVLSDELSAEGGCGSITNCLLLLWANRNRLPPSQLTQRVTTVLKALSELELMGKLTARDKYVSLFMLQHIEKEDARLLRQIRRKMLSVRKHYPGEIQRLLPAPGRGIRKKGKAKQKGGARRTA